MIRIILVCILVLIATPAWAVDRGTIEYVQQALADMGFDPGPVDGAWGGKTRGAVNQLRAEHGLRASEDFTGSSLALLHQVHPTERTLPFPGQLQTDAAARRAYLTANPEIGRNNCVGEWAPHRLDSRLEPFALLNSDNTPQGAILASYDWYSAIGEAFVGEAASCQLGNDDACMAIVSKVFEWADADALQSAIPQTSEEFDQIQWAAGSALRPMLSSFATARQLVNVPDEADAQIVDWLFDRAEFYYLPSRRTPREFVNQDTATNHQVSSALLYAMAGALVGDRVIFEQGLSQWDEAIGSMRADGSFPTETQRGARSLLYTGLQLNLLTGFAELARRQGLVLDARDSERTDYHDGVQFFADAFNDYDVVVDYALRDLASTYPNPRIPATTNFEQMMGFLPYYLSQFDSAENRVLFGALELDPLICSDEQISEGKATDWRCSGFADQDAPITLAQMLKGAALGHYNAGAIGACVHADRLNMFDVDAEIFPYSASEWSLDGERPDWVEPEPTVRYAALFESRVVMNHSPNDSSRFNLLIETETTDGDGQIFQFNLTGRATRDGHPDVSALMLILDTPVSQTTADALSACGTNVQVEHRDEGLMPSIMAVRSGETYAFDNSECLVSALPENYEMDAGVLFTGLNRFVEDFVRAGVVDRVENELIETWMRAVAGGERIVVAH